MIIQNLYTARAIAHHTWIKTIRRPVPLTFSFVQPIIWLLLFGFLFQKYISQSHMEGITYLEFLLPGVCCMTVLFGASQSGVAYIRDLQTGFLNRMLHTSASPVALYAGKISADVARFILQAGIICLIGLGLGVDYQVSLSSLFMAFALVILFAIFYASLSSFIALKTGAQETMASFIHVMNMPLLFTSSALVPYRQLPGWLQSIADFNPLTIIADAVRNALVYDQLIIKPIHTTILLVLACILFLLAVGALKRSIYSNVKQ